MSADSKALVNKLTDHKALVNKYHESRKKPLFDPTNFSLSSTPPSFQMNTGSLPPPSPTSAAASSLEAAERVAAQYLQEKEAQKAQKARAKEEEHWRAQDRVIKESLQAANASGQNSRSTYFALPPEATHLNEDENKERRAKRLEIMAKQDIVDSKLRLLGAEISKITNLKKKT